MGPIKLLAKGVTGAYGLAREAMADHQDKRPSGQPQLEVPSDAKDYDGSSDASSVSSSDGEEEAQELDEAQQKFAGGHKNQELQEAKDVDGVFKVLAKQHQQHPPPGYTEVAGKLDLPVILPQRRPKNKERGFVRAYAPVLQTCGIDQTEFLAFLDGFEKAIQLHPLFHVFNLACAGAVLATDIMVGPMFVVHVGAIVVHTSVEISRKQYVKYESNKYLDGMNEKFFKPHGLYALVMAYIPDSDDFVQDVDMNTNLLGSIASREVGHKSRFANAHGTTKREIEIPESAPLIFPELDALPENEKENVFKRSGKRLGDYFDRRAQAKFEKQNPDSKLNLHQERHFASRFSDPNHPANSGSLMALVSGGAIDTTESDRSKAEKKARKRQYRDARRVARGREPRYDAGGLNKKVAKGGIKGMMRSDVLYLMIVNYPTESELKEAAAVMEKLKQKY